jgi:hypothetical protein
MGSRGVCGRCQVCRLMIESLNVPLEEPIREGSRGPKWKEISWMKLLMK